MSGFRRVLVDGVARTVQVLDDRFEWVDGRRVVVRSVALGSDFRRHGPTSR